ncbi:class I SAM-dependent methyltransferase [Demequina muriae]|uniref:Methyltransferase n=1 Tax=Demequina muriae TaxID=3051664 RepID=A0ABT8GDN8_9MICO|nr:methyltransferase [Demequina sp. EGI L300058]MDN4479545.1 methyltransferase [Demequina sp. EGI L300058]
MSEDHYFTAEPASADERRERTVHLAGRDVVVETASGIFSPGHIDAGTQVLLRHLPPAPAGEVLDLGCGWGPLALTAALETPDARVTALDVNRRALDLVTRNAARLGVADRVRAVGPSDVPADATFAAIWSNPPIRIGKAALHDLLAMWLPRLAPGGEAWLVVQRNLGSDSLARWIADQRDDAGSPWGQIEKVASAKGFRVLRLTRPPE